MRSAIALFSLLALAGCDLHHLGAGIAGDGKLKTDSRTVGAFHAIEVDGAYTIEVVSGSAPKLSIETDSNLLPLVLTGVKDGVLTITNKKSISPTKCVIQIGTQNLESLALDGAGTIHVKDLDEKSFRLSVDGAGTITLAGKADSVEIGLDGAGTIDASELKSTKSLAKMDGTGTIKVHATEQVDADINGAGSILYGGNPKTVNQKVDGVGSIRAL